MSEIINVDKVEIAGFPHIIYAADWEVGFAEKASRLTAEFIDEGLEFTTPKLGYSSPTSIKLNGKSIGDYFPIQWETSQGRNQKTLKVLFVDKSSLLDRVAVMLIGQTGFPKDHSDDSEEYIGKFFKGEIDSDNIIFVGTEIDECSQTALDENNNIDPCHPCQEKFTNPELYEFKCREITACNRKQYDYSLTELLEEVRKQIGIGYSLAGIELNEGDRAYRVNYTGTIRQVLNNICSDIGLSFYYFNGSLNFFDLRSGLNINDSWVSGESKKIVSKNIKESLEGTRKNVGIGYFGRDCEERNYECGFGMCKRLVLNPIEIEDITKNYFHYSESSPVDMRKDKLIAVCGLRKIDQKLRDLMVWGSSIGHGINNADGADEKVNEPLQAFYGFTILKVFHSESDTVINGRDVFHKLSKRYYGASGDEEEGEDKSSKAIAKGSYFMIMRKNDLYAEKITKIEKVLADSFLGQYFFRNYKEHFAGASYGYAAPDSVNYIDFKSPVSLPFANELIEIQTDIRDQEFWKENFEEEADGTGAKAKDTFVLVQRPPVWVPVGLEDDDLTKISEMYDAMVPKQVDMGNEYDWSEIVPGFNEKTDALFVVEESARGRLRFEISDVVDHPTDSDNVSIPTEMCNKLTSYGLRSAKAGNYKITAGKVAIDLFAPSQVFQSKTGTPSKSGYTVIVNRSGDGFEQVLNKAEVFGYSEFGSLLDDYSEISMTLQDLTQGDLEYLIGDEENICKFDLNEISELLTDYVKQFSYNDPLFRNRSYTYVGVPDITFDPKDGIVSASFRIGSEGVTTNISYSNKTPAILSPDVFLRRLKHMELRKYLQRKVPSQTSQEINHEGDLLPEV